MEAIEMFLTLEWIQQFKNTIHFAFLLMVDANLSPPALEVSCQLVIESNVPVGFEPVSIAKSKRIAPIVKYVLDRSPNFLAMHFLALLASVVRLTRACDCLVSGMLVSISTSLDMMQSVAIGIAAAKASVEVDSNVPSQFSLPTITGDVMIVYSAAKLLQHQSKL
ncbi:hypothetical protein Goari_022056 [Gossypium aridum]|uniref:Uncharacterized protein n=1 Tax=Gossypium aridum TaxID=34290 RepID=A0A7J8YQZ1_GOSAI|nr:hypothetical protein [Gossypium aridum]